MSSLGVLSLAPLVYHLLILFITESYTDSDLLLLARASCICLTESWYTVLFAGAQEWEQVGYGAVYVGVVLVLSPASL